MAEATSLINQPDTAAKIGRETNPAVLRATIADADAQIKTERERALASGEIANASGKNQRILLLERYRRQATQNLGDVNIARSSNRSLNEVRSAERTSIARERAQSGVKTDNRTQREKVVEQAKAQRQQITDRSRQKGFQNRANLQSSRNARRASQNPVSNQALPIATIAGVNNLAQRPPEAPGLRPAENFGFRQKLLSSLSQSSTARDAAKLAVGLSVIVSGPRIVGSRIAQNTFNLINSNRRVQQAAGIAGAAVGGSQGSQIATESFVIQGTGSLSRSDIRLIAQQGIRESSPDGSFRQFAFGLTPIAGDRERFRASVGRQLAERGVTGSEFSRALSQAEAARFSLSTGEALTLGGTAAKTEQLFSNSISQTIKALPKNLASSRGSGQAFGRGATVVGAETTFGGVLEGAAVAGSQSFIRSGQVSPSDVALGGATGSLVAGSVGGLIGGLSASGRTGASRLVNAGVNVADPFEAFGDLAVSGGRRISRSRSPVPAVSRRGDSFRLTTASFTPNAAVTPTPGIVSSPSFSPSFTPSPIPTNSPIPTFSFSPSFTPSPVPVGSKVSSPSIIPSFSPTPSPSITPSPIPTSTPQKFFPFGFPDVNNRGGSRKRAGGSSFGASPFYAPSLFAQTFNIRAPEGSAPKGLFTGFELRPIIGGRR